MVGCNKKFKLIVNGTSGHIELRDRKTGELIRQIACKKCAPQISDMIQKAYNIKPKAKG